MNKTKSEVDCRWVSSRGILKSCDIHSATPISSVPVCLNYNWSEIKPGSTVYVSTSAVGDFSKILPTLPCPIILVSGDADENAPTQIFASEKDFLSFMESSKIIHWFAQNGVAQHSKFSLIPIGLDYHTMAQSSSSWGPQISSVEQEFQLQEISQHAPPLRSRPPLAYANFQFLMQTRYGEERRQAIKLIPADLVHYEPTKIDRKSTWKNQSQFAFVISPFGNGLDCHRTWEALCLGCIPIIKTSPLDELYHNLPVLIVKDWAEITAEKLQQVHTEMSARTFDLKSLTLAYWMEKINALKKDFR